MQFGTEAKNYTDPEKMAAAYLEMYYDNQKIEYPINPFRMLKDEGILFSLMDFKKLEGVYIPASSEDDLPFHERTICTSRHYTNLYKNQ